MPRRTSPDLRVDWKIRIDAALAGAIELNLGFVRGRPKYAARSKLIEQLLKEWLERQYAPVAESV